MNPPERKLYLDRKPLALAAPLAQGREGTVYRHPEDATLAIKLLRSDHPDPDSARPKIKALAESSTLTPATRGYLITWPKSPVTTSAKPDRARVAGYTMTLLDTTRYRHIGSYLNPARRRRMTKDRAGAYTYLHLVGMARNLAAAAAALHRRDILIGDLNSRNIMATDQTRIALIDVDSFQTVDPATGRKLRCPVGTPEYTPSRLQGVDFGAVDRRLADDDFALAVMIYQLLFQGSHPFAGTATPRPNQTSLAERISAGLFAHAKTGQPTPHSLLIWKDTPLKKPFNAAFTGSLPPTAQEWHKLLSEAARKLRQCRSNPAHWHFTDRCTWCRYMRHTELDPFPQTEAPPPKRRSKPARKRRPR